MRIQEILNEDASFNTFLDKFKQQHAKSIATGCNRNYCEVPTTDLVAFGKEHGYQIDKVYGNFVVGEPEFAFEDFTILEKQNMKFSFLDPNSKEDRIKFATKHKLIDELKKVPHYWNEYNGQIIDLTGHAQFVETGLATDLNTNRYKKDITERQVYRGLSKPHDTSHAGHITWYTDDEAQAKQYTDGTDDGVVLVHDIPDAVVERSFDHGFRTEHTEVKADDFADRVKQGIISAFNKGWISKDAAMDLVDELLDLELSNTYKKVFMWWHDDATFTNILKKAGYKAIHNVENGIDTYGIIT